MCQTGTDAAQADEHDAQLDAVIEDAQQLAQRLQRLAVALALTEEFIAESVDELVASRSADDKYRQRASQARTLAHLCRDLSARLQDAGVPTGEFGRVN